MGKIFAFQAVLFTILVGLWFTIFVHLDGSNWGYATIAVGFAERVFRFVRIHYRSNGTTWYDL